MKNRLAPVIASAVLTGRARLHGRDIVIGVFDFAFLGGSMGSVVGEKIALACDQIRLGRADVVLAGGTEAAICSARLIRRGRAIGSCCSRE